MENFEAKTIYDDNKYLHFMEAVCSDGKKWAYVKRVNTKGVVIIVPLILDLAEPSTLFLKTKRPPLIAEKISDYNLEFPAGLVGDENFSETFEDALKKELLEETGLKADKFIIKTTQLTSSAGCTSEVSTLAIAKITNSKIYQKPVSDGGIIQERITVPLSEIKNFLSDFQKKDNSVGAQTLAGIYYLFEEVNLLGF